MIISVKRVWMQHQVKGEWHRNIFCEQSPFARWSYVHKPLSSFRWAKWHTQVFLSYGKPSWAFLVSYNTFGSHSNIRQCSHLLAKRCSWALPVFLLPQLMLNAEQPLCWGCIWCHHQSSVGDTGDRTSLHAAALMMAHAHPHPHGAHPHILPVQLRLRAPSKDAWRLQHQGSATPLSILEMRFKSKQTKPYDLLKTRRVEQTDLPGLRFACFAHSGCICVYACTSQHRRVCSHISSHALWLLTCTKMDNCTVD